MRIALITDGVWPYVVGGMQKHSYYLAKYLARNNVAVDLFHYNNSKYSIDALEFFTDNEKKNIRSIVLTFPSSDKLPGHYIRSSYKYACLVYEAILPTLNTYDFIYTKGLTGWKLIEQKRKGVKTPPIGVKFHGYEMFQKAPSIKSKLEQLLLLRKPVTYITQNADYVFSYGGKISHIINNIGVKTSKIIEIPTGIDAGWCVDAVRESNDELNFVFIGRYERRKGIMELHSVIQDLFAKHYTFKFHFIGPIPDDKQIRHKKISYHGSITNENQLKQLLGQSDVLVCPSYSEGMPNVILEGMASGLAIIATDVGAVSEMVTSSNGYLISKMSKNTLKDAMLSFLDLEKSMITNMKRVSIQKVQKQFLWDVIIQKHIAHFSSIKKAVE